MLFCWITSYWSILSAWFILCSILLFFFFLNSKNVTYPVFCYPFFCVNSSWLSCTPVCRLQPLFILLVWALGVQIFFHYLRDSMSVSRKWHCISYYCIEIYEFYKTQWWCIIHTFLGYLWCLSCEQVKGSEVSSRTVNSFLCCADSPNYCRTRVGFS